MSLGLFSRRSDKACGIAAICNLLTETGYAGVRRNLAAHFILGSNGKLSGPPKRTAVRPDSASMKSRYSGLLTGGIGNEYPRSILEPHRTALIRHFQAWMGIHDGRLPGSQELSSSPVR
jgi:hypothetical protein